MAQRLLGMRAAAGYLGIAVSTLYHWVREGHITVVKVGRLNKFRQLDLDELIEQGVRPRKGE
jgi:excisionase family DNA binding protein